MPIQVKNVFFTYNQKTSNEVLALDDINVEIKDGSITGILGETGSGKSTLVQQLNGLILPSKGEIDIDGFKVLPKKNKKLHELRKHVGVVFQFPEYQLFEETLEKDVAFGPRNFGMSKEDSIKAAHEALKTMGFDETYFTKSPFELSGGERRKAAIAGILAFNPDILVLDEPTAGLDAASVMMLVELIFKLKETGKTIVIVSHDVDFVLKYCTDVIVLYRSKLVASCKPYELFSGDCEQYGIEKPQVFKLAQFVNAAGLNLDLRKIVDLDTFITELERAKHE